MYYYCVVQIVIFVQPWVNSTVRYKSVRVALSLEELCRITYVIHCRTPVLAELARTSYLVYRVTTYEWMREYRDTYREPTAYFVVVRLYNSSHEVLLLRPSG